jgi:hypothetical protein
MAIPVRELSHTVTGPNMANGASCASNMFTFTVDSVQLTMQASQEIGGPGFYTCTLILGV